MGFGNAVSLQTTFIALIAHLPESSMAVGTGFAHLFRGLGQVSGVCISSALFQSKLDSELRSRIHTPDADQLIQKIRHSARLVATLPPDIQQAARDSYAVSLQAVFILAACSTFLAYIARLPIPEKALEHRTRRRSSIMEPVLNTNGVIRPDSGSPSVLAPSPTTNILESPESSGTDSDEENRNLTSPIPVRPGLRPRRLSTFEEADAVMDLEGDRIGGSARQRVKIGGSA